ncbi:MAG: OmpA family protein [Pseudomonadota bacterium]
MYHLLRVIALGVCLCVSGVALAQNNADLRATLFDPVDAVLKEANQAQANILAPKSYAKAAEAYLSAEKKLDAGRSIDSIRKDLEKAKTALTEATAATQVAKVTFAAALEARADAIKADAERYAPENWKEAEVQLAEAAQKLEAGREKSAQERGEEARALYRSAELSAIKANYLDETRRLIAQARENKVQKLVPQTLGKAESLLQEAEQALSEDRYDTDRPRQLAADAKYEAAHAIYLAQILGPIMEEERSLEDYALAAEAPLQTIATALDQVPRFDKGAAPIVEDIVRAIGDLQSQANENTDRGYQIISLEEDIADLERQLGIQSERLEAQEAERLRFKKLQGLFTTADAEVLTQGNAMLIRLTSLSFETGSAKITPDNYALLVKVQQAIALYPQMAVIVEGHTDSFGSDDKNLALSQERADALRTYLLANTDGMSAFGITAIGYGEARPVANNETKEGRAKNRRIDLVLQPAAGE